MGRLQTAARHLRLAARALRHGLPPVPRVETTSYSDQELLARAEEFNRNAELHWRKIASEPSGREHVLNKPFSTVRDTPDILYRLGLVLHALDLGVGMTVLDFGAGSCWLSSSINRLRCRTVSMDVSPTALALGEELFRTDTRHHLELEPRFIPYDGHRIPLEDASVDRIVCFDSFHHVPNQDEVLTEFFRVLQPGGRLVMAEPGGGEHACSDRSVFETDVYGVLENDLRLDDLARRARRIGFSAVDLLPYPDVTALTMPAERYQQLIDGDESVFPIHTVQTSLRNFYLMILPKGEPRWDSRNPRKLAATIEPRTIAFAARAADHVELDVRIQNIGDTLWLRRESNLGGQVRLGGHLLSAGGETLKLGHAYASLTRDVAPGESIDLHIRIPTPERPGRYRISLDMVDEWIIWFEQCGSHCARLDLDVVGFRDSRDPHRLAARITRIGDWPAGAVLPGSPVATRLRLENVGDTAWHAGPARQQGAVALAAALVDGEGRLLARDYFRQPLTAPLDPGQSMEIDVLVPAPSDAGPHVLRFDLVAEGVCWFEHMGSSPLELPITGSADIPDSTRPGRLGARLERIDAPGDAILSGAPGTETSIRLRAVNTGNTRWLSSPEPRVGHVALGGHLEGADGRSIEPDFLRSPLPEDVAPGAALEFDCAIGLPNAVGPYRLVLDLVDEGLQWFSAAGSAPVVVHLHVR